MYLCIVKQIKNHKKMKAATLKTLEQTDNVSLYSICFDGSAVKFSNYEHQY